MKNYIKLLAIGLFLVGGQLFAQEANWLTDFEAAKESAVEENRVILLNFSGSDWCGSCIRLEKELFDQAEFATLADEKLVLVNADFPMKKANKLSPEQTAHNEALAEIYNKKGAFPTTLVLDAEGNIITSLPPTCGDVNEYIAKIQAAIN